MPDLGVYSGGFNPYDTGWFGSKIAKKVGRRVGKIASGAARGVVRGVKTVAPIAAQALPVVQQAMKLSGPIGMVASGAAGALAATVRGESLEKIAWAAAEGASPPGIDRAISAARALREGQPVLNVAIAQVRQQFAPGSAGQRAFDLGVSAAKGGTKGALASARNQLRSGTEQAAFDAAIGTLSKAAGGLPRAPMTQADPMGLAMRAARRVTRSLPIAHPNTQLALSAMRRSPGLRRMSFRDASRSLNLPLRAIAEARGLLDDAGLVSDKLHTYTVRSGDTGSTLAKRFTGDSNRWREIPKVNRRGEGSYAGNKDMIVKQSTTTIKGKKVPVTLLEPFYSGLRINLPGDWNVPGSVAQPIPGAAIPSSPPTPVPTSVPEPSLPAPPVPVPAPTPASPIPGVPIPSPVPQTPTAPPSPIPGVPPVPGIPPVPGVPGVPIPEPPSTPIPGGPPTVPVPTVPVATTAKKSDGGAAALALLGASLFLM